MKRFLGLGVLLMACIANPALAAEPSYRVTLTLFNFYDDDVRLTINGEKIYSGHLKADPSTGGNMSRQLALPRCNTFELVSTRVTFKKQVCLKDSTKGVFINPLDKPYVEISDRAGPSLD